jgi:hypothetical protein
VWALLRWTREKCRSPECRSHEVGFRVREVPSNGVRPKKSGATWNRTKYLRVGLRRRGARKRKGCTLECDGREALSGPAYEAGVGFPTVRVGSSRESVRNLRGSIRYLDQIGNHQPATCTRAEEVGVEPQPMRVPPCSKRRSRHREVIFQYVTYHQPCSRRESNPRLRIESAPSLPLDHASRSASGWIRTSSPSFGNSGHVHVRRRLSALVPSAGLEPAVSALGPRRRFRRDLEGVARQGIEPCHRV